MQRSLEIIYSLDLLPHKNDSIEANQTKKHSIFIVFDDGFKSLLLTLITILSMRTKESLLELEKPKKQN